MHSIQYSAYWCSWEQQVKMLPVKWSHIIYFRAFSNILNAPHWHPSWICRPKNCAFWIRRNSAQYLLQWQIIHPQNNYILVSDLFIYKVVKTNFPRQQKRHATRFADIWLNQVWFSLKSLVFFEFPLKSLNYEKVWFENHPTRTVNYQKLKDLTIFYTSSLLHFFSFFDFLLSRPFSFCYFIPFVSQ